MHILYYNFHNSIHPLQKLLKILKEKIKRLYDDGLFSLHDNVIIIVNEKIISETLFKALHSLNVSLDISDSPDGVYDDFKQYIKPDYVLHKDILEKHLCLIYLN